MPTTTLPTESSQTLQELQSKKYKVKMAAARQDINSAYWAGLFCGGINLLLLLVVIRSEKFAEGQIPQYLVGLMAAEVMLIFWLCAGIRKAHQGSAQFLLGYFLIMKVIQVVMGNFTPFMFPVAGLLTFFFCRGVVGTAAYHSLQELAFNAQSLDRSYSYPDDSEEEDEDENADDSDPGVNVAPAPKAVRKFWVADELVELCCGDRSQAEWLIHQLRVKHPEQDMNWYNERAIGSFTRASANEQLSHPKVDD